MSPSQTGVPSPTTSQRSSIFAHSPPMWPGSMAIFRPASGCPERSAAVRRRCANGGEALDSPQAAKRRWKISSVGELPVWMRASVSSISMQAPPGLAGGENGGEQSLEFLAGDGVLVDFQRTSNPAARRASKAPGVAARAVESVRQVAERGDENKYATTASRTIATTKSGRSRLENRLIQEIGLSGERVNVELSAARISPNYYHASDSYFISR